MELWLGMIIFSMQVLKNFGSIVVKDDVADLHPIEKVAFATRESIARHPSFAIQ